MSHIYSPNRYACVRRTDVFFIFRRNYSLQLLMLVCPALTVI
uniref:Uncharacterized protein n=1 Tax=Anguilla anguilla TaxID=7936 RepID=A0A0E9XP15_ANGAN